MRTDNFVYNYNKMLECLSFMELDISELDDNRLKKQYRSLAKKYHPDSGDYYEVRQKTAQFQRLANCYEYLNYCLECRFLWEDKINSSEKNDYGRSDNNLAKYYQDVINRLDRMIRPLNMYLNGHYNKVIKHIVNNLLNNIETLKIKTKNPDTILDYGTLANYCDLIELFMDKVLNIKSSIEFDYDKNNYVGNDNDNFFKEKGEICFLEKVLLYEVMIKIIDFISNEGKYIDIKLYRKKIEKYFLIIDEITDSIYSFKWMMVLPNIDNRRVYSELNRIRKKEGSFRNGD